VDLFVSTLGGMDCILGMEFITQNNVFIEGHNRLVRISSKSRIVQMKAHKLPCMGGSTIHFMLGKTWERERVCRNPSFGFVTKAKGLQGCRPRESLGVTSHTPESVRKCEGVNPHTPKATPTLGDGVHNFRERFQRSKLNGL